MSIRLEIKKDDIEIDDGMIDVFVSYDTFGGIFAEIPLRVMREKIKEYDEYNNIR